MNVETEVLVPVISAGVSLVAALVAMRSGLNHIERALAEFRTEVRETLNHINDRCETHGEAIGQHNTRIALVEREIVHFGDRVRILSGDKTGLRGTIEPDEHGR